MCTSPRNASYNSDGSINFSKKHYNKELVPFQLPCGKCAECLLERARQWSIRCLHEARSHENNCFITLTYADEKLPPDNKLRYLDFQLFMKRLRKKYGPEIGFFMCGEYGDQTHRPHYHACLFGLDFEDKKLVRKNDHGDDVWNSEKLTEIWTHGHTEIGSVTQKSAGYVARYILKKQGHEQKCFQKMSVKNAIGKKWIERHWKDVFVHARGSIILSDGSSSKIPRYYEKWFRENKEEEWLCYIEKIKIVNTKRLEKKAKEEHEIYLSEMRKRKIQWNYKTPLARKRKIIAEKAKQLKRGFL